MDSQFRTLIKEGVLRLVHSNHRVIVHRTGSVGALDQWLWEPGASSFLDSVDFTYGREATEELVGRRIKPPFVHEDVAIQMAAAAYERASKFAAQRGDSYRPIIAVGVTSAVSTNRSRAGEDRAIICVRIRDGFFLVDVQMDKAIDTQVARDIRREEQAELIDLIALNMILWAAGFDQVGFNLEGLYCRELEPVGEGMAILRPRQIDTIPKDIFDQVFWGDRDATYPGGLSTPVDVVDWSTVCLLPGSFHPLHYGHLAMAKWMAFQTGRRVVFQISQHHPIKVGLAQDEQELRRRLLQFRFRYPVVITRHDGLYFDKARCFPGAHILMGADALLSLLDLRFYAQGREELSRELEACRDRGTVFWVVDREWQGAVRSLSNISIPTGYEDLFRHLAAVNRISSSEIRSQCSG